MAALLLACGSAGAPVLAQTAPALDEAALTAKAQAIFKEQCQRDTFSGAILIAQGQRVVTEAVCGEASKRYHAANRIDTKFNLASIGKMFTGVAIAQLAEAGKLSYTDKISKFIDASWLPASVTDRITIAQLLTHSSGLAEFLNQDRANHSSRALYRELDDLKPLLQNMGLEFEPGSRYLYSNTGYVLLGVIIQKASGQNYFDYVRQHIYQVAGMTDSDSYALDEPVENLATGYNRTRGQTKYNHDTTFEGLLRGFSFGCGYSTVHDLLRFTQALQDGKLLKPATLDEIWQNHAPKVDKKDGGYGYGFELASSPAGRVVGHSGSFPGVIGNVDIYRDSGYVVIVLSNYRNEFPMASQLGDLLVPGKRP
ncbi:serine hydrolase domain-containing protein [Undibacterium sp. TJN19]|uniref:serine hydrolase domain-containing protein n=1 Tax=Undibacterium sp. TJN19 TaxID=3413055 RepID=UPI003BF29436